MFWKTIRKLSGLGFLEKTCLEIQKLHFFIQKCDDILTNDMKVVRTMKVAFRIWTTYEILRGSDVLNVTELTDPHFADEKFVQQLKNIY